MSRHFVSEAEPTHHSNTVRLERDAGADLSQSWGLLVDTDLNASLAQGDGGGNATDATANDRYAQWTRHVFFPSDRSPRSYSVR